MISGDELRSELAAWPRTVREFTENEEFIVDWVNLNAASIYRAAPMASGFEGWTGDVTEGVLTPEVARFLTSDTGRTYAAMRAYYEWYAFRDGERLLGVVDSVIALLERELRT